MKSWSTTQATVALSSGEAELYGIVKGSSEGIGYQSLLRDLGIEASVEVKADASAALGIVNRIGLGKVRHLHTNWLWVQEKAKTKEVNYDKVPGSANPADILTKAVESELMERHCQTTQVKFPTDMNEEGYVLGTVSETRRQDGRGEDGDEQDGQDNGEDEKTVVKELCSKMKAQAWRREDLGRYCLRSSAKGGPKWSEVVCRVTTDGVTKKVLRIEDKEDLRSQVTYHKQWTRPKDTATTLIYRTGGQEGRR